jgi:Putative esterase
MVRNWTEYAALILVTAVSVTDQQQVRAANNNVVAKSSEATQQAAGAASGKVKFDISFPASVHPAPITGRIFLFISKNDKTEPRLGGDVVAFGVDVHATNPDEPVVINDATPGFPVSSLNQIPAGDYYVQALLNVYTEFHRADGHVIWAHMDQWEGQDMARSPGNLISESQKVRLDSSAGYKHELQLNKVIPPIEVPPDTEWVRHVRFESKLLSRFWGHPIYIGAIVLLPKGYDAHPDAHFPAIYLQGHFSLEAPFGFTTEPDKPGTKSWARQREEWNAKHLNVPEPPDDVHYNGSLMNVESGYEFYQAWKSDGFPRMIAVTFQHPTPYFDDSYGINSANAGPYGDAIMQELIPYVEEHFRVIRQPYARALTGGSTGGWSSLALQVYHPDFFGGTWTFYPDPVDFRSYYGGVNLYEDRNAFAVETGHDWLIPERYCCRSHGGQVEISNRQFSQLASILGAQDAGFEWVNYTPVGSDGYPNPPWNLTTGTIDRDVVNYMERHDYDLREYLERNWSRIGPQLVGKLHLYCGDEDGAYLNLAVYLLEDFLANTKNPYYAGSFQYGRPLKGHGWQPTTNAELVKEMASQITKNAPKTEDTGVWKHD